MYKLPRFVTEFANYQMDTVEKLDLDSRTKTKLQQRITRIHHHASMGESLVSETMAMLVEVTTPEYIDRIQSDD